MSQYHWVDTAIGIKYIYMAGSCVEETKPVVKQFVLGGIASCSTYNLPMNCNCPNECIT